MSKTTKIIAALGVVAGLGVAALPAFSYAAQTPQSVTGDAELFVEVQPAIAMTITGNNDDGQLQAYNSYQYTIVADPQGNPSTSNYYERAANGTFTASTDTEVDTNKTYFTRSANTQGVDVFSPMSKGNGEVNGHEEAFLAGPSSSYLQILPNSINTMTSTVTVYTNNASGYTLTVKDADSDTSLKNGNIEIVAHATPTAGEARWSIEGGSLSASAITAAGLQVKQTDTKTTGGDATTMTYTVSTAADQATGVYTDTITYTATTN